MTISCNLAQLSECARNEVCGGQSVCIVGEPDGSRRILALLRKTAKAKGAISWLVNNEECRVRVCVIYHTTDAKERRQVVGQK